MKMAPVNIAPVLMADQTENLPNKYSFLSRMKKSYASVPIQAKKEIPAASERDSLKGK